jgi:hypothetical protein
MGPPIFNVHINTSKPSSEELKSFGLIHMHTPIRVEVQEIGGFQFDGVRLGEFRFSLTRIL